MLTTRPEQDLGCELQLDTLLDVCPALYLRGIQMRSYLLSAYANASGMDGGQHD
jgi:hypothetical protein